MRTHTQARVSAVLGAARRPGRIAARRRRVQISQGGLGVICLVAVVAVAALVAAYPLVVPWMGLVPVILVSGYYHRPLWHGVILAASFAAVGVVGVLIAPTRADAPIVVLALAAVAIVTTWRSVSRSRLGLRGAQGDSFLADLHERLEEQGRLPSLPEPWALETAQSTAGGDGFSGDIVVTHFDGEDRLEVVLVDVCGKGLIAGGRSVMLAGSLNALLSSMPSERFLPAANRYLCRQNWEDGFASAVHLSLTLSSGEFLLRSAGHPPTLLRRTDGRWTPLDIGGGPVLGVIADAEFPARRGRFDSTTALAFYTDGVVESSAHDLDESISQLAKLARECGGEGVQGLAQRLCDRGPGERDDDRTVVTLFTGQVAGPTQAAPDDDRRRSTSPTL